VPARRWAGRTSDSTTSDTPDSRGPPATGASIAELMGRAGHASQTAALRYQHATDDRDRVLAQALARLADQSGEEP
jgi:hypothetical protein